MRRYALLAAVVLSACTTTNSKPMAPVDTGSVEPGTSVGRAGQPMSLAKGRIDQGGPLPQVPLVDQDGRSYKFATDGLVKVVSVVPSIDTQVCEQQTHILAEAAVLDPRIQRLTLSRDLPTAQKRFATESGLLNITYLSDYQNGDFGRATGLLIEENGLLARAVMVVDGEGRVRYLQVVPDVTRLPDMAKAFAEANKLVR